MIVLKDKNEQGINQILAENPGASVGKFSIDLQHFKQNKPILQRYKDAAAALKAAGCTIIVFEVVDMSQLKLDSEGYVTHKIVYDFDNAIQKFKTALPDVNYLLFYDILDRNTYPRHGVTTTNIVANRLKADKYVEKFKLTKDEKMQLINICKNAMVFDEPITVAYCDTATGFWFHAFEDYAAKYLNRTVITVPTDYDTSAVFDDTLVSFVNAVKNLPDGDWLNWATLESVAANLGGRIKYRKVEIPYKYIIGVEFITDNNGSIKLDRKIGRA